MSKPYGRSHAGRDVTYALERGQSAALKTQKVGSRPTLVNPDLDRTLHINMRPRALARGDG